MIQSFYVLKLTNLKYINMSKKLTNAKNRPEQLFTKVSIDNEEQILKSLIEVEISEIFHITNDSITN